MPLAALTERDAADLLASNQMLGYVPDLRNHPAVHYINAGIPIVLSPDDVASSSRGRVQLTTDGHKPYLEVSKPRLEWRSTPRR